MSIRKFRHTYEPAGSGTSGIDPIQLTTAEIGSAAISEIVQMSLSASPFTLLLDEILESPCDWFRWIAQLGQVRETRTALSGLFGRFVARAYLERYHNFRFFDPIVADTQSLHAGSALAIQRIASGDRPDWIVSTAAPNPVFAIAEAKGSHNCAGAASPLSAAKKQAERMALFAGATQLTIKRFAIATRWAVSGHARLIEPWLCVHDPEDGEREPTPTEQQAVYRGIVLSHFASLARGLGASSLASALEEARNEDPGSLAFDRSELVEIDLPEGERTALVALIAGSTILRLPKEVTPQFKSSVQNVFGDRVLALIVDEKQFSRADMMPFDKVLTPETEGSAESFESIWQQRRRRPDGTELVPLKDIEFRVRST